MSNLTPNNFSPIIVRDERINAISTNLDIMMKKGGAQSTYQSQNATSVSTTGVSYTVTAPSESVILDRHIKMQSTFKIKIVISTGVVADTKQCFAYGLTEALSAYPLNSLILTSTVQINSSTVSVNTQDSFGILSKMYCDDKDGDAYHCPTMLDQKFKMFGDMAVTESSPLGSFTNSKGDVVPRGAHPIDSFRIERYVTGQALPNATATQASSDTNIIAALTCASMATNSWIIELVFTTIEPLLFLSPLIFGKTNNNAGLFGVNSFNLNLNLDTTAKRVLSSASTYPFTVSLEEVRDCKLLLNYITPQPSDLIAPTNVVPFTDYQRYITIGGTAGGGESRTVPSNSVQFNSIPSKIFVCVRKQMNTMTCKDSNFFLPITKCSVNFNNMSGLLASATQHDLYTMSKKNGLNQSVYEFFGKSSIANGLNKPTIGGFLVLDPVDFGLPEYLAPGSTGNFNFQIDVTFTNTDTAAVVYELMILTENDGIFITQNGQSTKQTALFTKALTAEASMSQHGESSEYIKQFTKGHSMSNVPLLNMSKSGSGAKSGGSFSAGAQSGGSMAGTAGNYTRQALQRLHNI